MLVMGLFPLERKTSAVFDCLIGTAGNLVHCNLIANALISCYFVSVCTSFRVFSLRAHVTRVLTGLTILLCTVVYIVANERGSLIGDLLREEMHINEA